MLDAFELFFLIGSVSVPGLYLYIRRGVYGFIFVFANVGVVSLVGMVVSMMESSLLHLNHEYLPSLYHDGAPQVLWPIYDLH